MAEMAELPEYIQEFPEFRRLAERQDETGWSGEGERCDATNEDPSTPSGRTRCALDAGHGGAHIHANQTRTLEWEDPS